MYRSIVSSLGLHLLAFTIAYNGLPEIKKNLIKEKPVNIVFELPVSDKTSIKNISDSTLKKSEKKNKEIAKPVTTKKRNVPEPIPKKKKQVFEKKIEKVSVKPKIKPKTKPKKIIKILEKVKKENDLIKIKPQKRKNKKSNKKKDMAEGLLKSLAEAKEKKILNSKKVDDLKRKLKKASKQDKTNQVNELKNKLLAAVDNKKITKNEKISMSISEIDLLKHHIKQCWAPPFGANYDLKGTFIDLQIDTNPDGTVINVKILEKQKYIKSPIYRATADSARRAVFECSPLPLPKQKYDRWKKFIFEFDPSFASNIG